MIHFFDRIKTLFNKKLETTRIEVDFVKDILSDLKTRIAINKIKRIEDIYSNVVTLESAKWLQKELARNCSPNEIINLEASDYLGVHFIVMIDGGKYLYANVIHANFEKECGFFKRVNDYPFFKTRNLVVYEDGFCLPILETSNKIPIKINV